MQSRARRLVRTLRCRWLTVLFVLLPSVMTACSLQRPAGRPRLDAIAQDYVRLQLAIGTHDKDHVAWYYGPPQWRAEVEARPPSIEVLRRTAEQLLGELQAIPIDGLDALTQRRRTFLVAHLRAAHFRLDMLAGVRRRFDEEAQTLFGVEPKLLPLESYDSVLERIDSLLPGAGPLAQRVDAFRNRHAIAVDRLDAVMRFAIDECRRRTATHIALPDTDAFSLELVRDKGWSGNNLYLGAARGTIQVNTDFPVGIDRAVELACHEAYPGHHTHISLLDARLVQARGWVEYSVLPLYGPIAFIAEGEASYAWHLAFPRDELERFESEQLFELAGLDPAAAPAVSALREATSELAGARLTIGRMFIDGEIDREQALDLLQRYQLVSRAFAGQILSFITKQRSYIINYGLGEPAVRKYLHAASGDDNARWRAMERLLAEPTLPADLEVTK